MAQGCSVRVHSRILREDLAERVVYVSVLDGEERVLEPLVHGLGLLHGRDVDVLLDVADVAYRCYHHCGSGAEHFQ